MFNRKAKSDVLAEIETLIGAGTRIEGDVAVTGGVHIEGYVKGNVATVPGGTAVLSIAEKGVVEGTVDVPRVVVHGEVKGDIRATGKVELGATARISGNVAYGIIEMAAGALIQGRLMAIATATAVPATEAAGAANAPAAAGSNA